MCIIEYALRLRCSCSTCPMFLRFMIDKYLCHTCFHTESYVMDQIFYPWFLFKKCVISQVFFVLIKQRPAMSCSNKCHTWQENMLDKWEPLVSLLIEKRFFICILFCLSCNCRVDWLQRSSFKPFCFLFITASQRLVALEGDSASHFEGSQTKHQIRGTARRTHGQKIQQFCLLCSQVIWEIEHWTQGR